MEWEEFAEKVKAHVLLKWVLFRIHKMENGAIKKVTFAIIVAICFIVVSLHPLCLLPCSKIYL